jgi:hypothetical protein
MAGTRGRPIDLSGLADFNRFYEIDTSAPIKLSGGNNRIERYRPVRWNERCTTRTFQTRVSLAGVLYLDCINNSPAEFCHCIGRDFSRNTPASQPSSRVASFFGLTYARPPFLLSPFACRNVRQRAR